MHSFVAGHVHWLWLFFHKLKHPYSKGTLYLFVFVGAIQTFIAVAGGALAAEALETGEKRKNRLKTEFWLLGLALFGATLWTGILNDDSQRATDGRADDLKQQLTELSNSVTGVAQLDAEINKQRTNGPQTPAQSRLEAQLQQAINRTNDLAKRYSTLPPTSNSTSQPPAPTPSQQTPQQNIFPQPQSRYIVPTPASVQANIDQTLKKIADIDRNAHSFIQGTLSPVRQLYVMGGGGFAVPVQQSREQAFRNTIPQLESIVKNRSEALQGLLPEINQERTDARQLLKLSVSEITADQRAFDTAVEKSNTKIVFPKSWAEAGFLYQLQYGDMDAYLLALQQRLKALP